MTIKQTIDDAWNDDIEELDLDDPEADESDWEWTDHDSAGHSIS